jgi:hypothetical protein
VRPDLVRAGERALAAGASGVAVRAFFRQFVD